MDDCSTLLGVTDTETQLLDLVRVREMCLNGDAQALREDAGLSIRDLASHVDVSPTTLSEWEQGRRRPRGEAAIRYARALNIIGNR